MTREEAAKMIKDDMRLHHDYLSGAYRKALKIAIKALEETEIIHCKECMNHGKEICYFWSRFYGTINTPDDGFCHKAERRTDE